MGAACDRLGAPVGGDRRLALPAPCASRPRGRRRPAGSATRGEPGAERRRAAGGDGRPRTQLQPVAGRQRRAGAVLRSPCIRPADPHRQLLYRSSARARRRCHRQPATRPGGRRLPGRAGRPVLRRRSHRDGWLRGSGGRWRCPAADLRLHRCQLRAPYPGHELPRREPAACRGNPHRLRPRPIGQPRGGTATERRRRSRRGSRRAVRRQRRPAGPGEPRPARPARERRFGGGDRAPDAVSRSALQLHARGARGRRTPLAAPRPGTRSREPDRRRSGLRGRGSRPSRSQPRCSTASSIPRSASTPTRRRPSSGCSSRSRS